ncbi:MAG TPA: hypothetical protein VI997_12310 [Candidatus Thermoplasmatota archaeon]|nr:hypothetical protein [Candidatus Thermoplasmatota archaeon]
MSEERVVREIQKETREELTLLELDRLDRPQKRAAESSRVEAVSHAEFGERDWRKRRAETLPEIQRIVDAMGTPREERLKIGERVFLPPDEPLPPTRALTDLERRAIERHLGAKVLRASIIYRSNRGHVVEVEHVLDGARDVTILSVLGERVRDLRGIHERIDELSPKVAPIPDPAAPAPAGAAAAEPAAEPVRPEYTDVTPPAPEPAAEPVASPTPAGPESAPSAVTPAKRRFGLPSFGKKKEDATAAAGPESEAPAEPAKKRFSLPKLGRKKGQKEPPAG